jgi:hypothetical protein
MFAFALTTLTTLIENCYKLFTLLNLRQTGKKWLSLTDP